MTQVLAAVLRDAMIERLAGLACKAAATPTVTELAELGDLTSAMREILALHQPDCHGRCRSCSGWRRHRRFPCPVWLIAHRHLLVPVNHHQLTSGA